MKQSIDNTNYKCIPAYIIVWKLGLVIYMVTILTTGGKLLSVTWHYFYKLEILESDTWRLE